MAELHEISELVLQRFKDVPNVTEEDAEAWTLRAFIEHGYAEDANVPDNQTMLLLLYAEWDAALNLAMNTAYYFEYKDAEESVDKRLISEQYRRLATELRKRYDAKKAEGSGGLGGSRFNVMTRVDRP